MDRAYLDFERLFGLHEAGAFFITRAKSNADLRRIYSAPSDRAQGIICDQTVALSGFYSHKHFPHHLRRIRFKDPETEKTLIFLTNLFGPPPANCTKPDGRSSCSNGSSNISASRSSMATQRTP
jgi:hypothetical protein